MSNVTNTQQEDAWFESDQSETGRAKNVILAIGSGLKLYREYLVSSAAARARQAGYDLVLINNLQPTWQHDYFDEITVTNVFDHELLAKTAREIAGRHTVVGVLCWDEPLVMSAAELAAEFGVPGLSIPGVQGCRDKYSARTRLTAAGLLQPGFAMAADLAQARAAAERIGYPVVVKPRALGASMGVVLARDPEELASAFGVAADASLVGEEAFRGGAIIEEYAVGPEISIDSAVHKGECLPMFVARKQTGPHPYFEEIGHVVDATDPLLTDPSLLDTLTRAHQVLGISDGITHTEVRLTERGPLIIEINGRVGGDLIPFLGKLATGIDPGTIMVEVALGLRPDINRTGRGAVGIRFGYPEHDCLVHSVRVPVEAPGLMTAAPMVEPGTTLRLPPGGYIARHSFVVCRAEDPISCAERLVEASALVVLDAEEVAAKPAGSVLEMPAGLLDVDR
ncbi:MAG: ATP-grasp domain-containing protein [Nocardioides sp.]